VRVYFYEEDRARIKVSTSRYRFALTYVEGKDVLDVGCGARKGPWILSERARRVTGVDVSGEAIDYCRKNWGKGNIEYIVADAGDLPFAGGSFDTVISFEVIEHIGDYERYLGEITRVMKKDGIFIISTPNRPVASPGGRSGNPDHVREFDMGEFRDILRRYFPDVTVYGQFVSERVRRIEDSRKMSLAAAGRIPGAIKSILPSWLKESALKRYHYIRARFLGGADERKIDESDFTITRNGAEKGRYLLAVCKGKRVG
jgi:ubiquinone/menaquinone biosynthesis C-methylase UbiE